MKKINNYYMYKHAKITMPVNFMLVKNITVTKYLLPVKHENKLYKCDFVFRIKYHKPLDIY
jgi:hypothetical protein